MRKFWLYFLAVSILALGLSVVRPVLATPGGTTGTGTTDTIRVKNINVVTSFVRDWSWSVVKSTSTPSLTLSPGQTGLASYSVTATGTPVDSGWQATGQVTFTNLGTNAITVQSVVVDFGGGITVVPTCQTPPGYPPTLQSGWTVNCTYSVSLPDGSPRTAIATVTTTDVAVSDPASVVFGVPATVTNTCVNVDDTLGGFLGQVCGSTNPTVQTFNYNVNVGPFATCGPQTVNNTATIRETGASSSATVAVNVPCAGGCTLTQGYWKTHSAQGPAPYDPAWMNIGALQEQTPFFLSGSTWYGVFWTAPAGNAYYNLAHQYMAAKLNVLDGASAPADVTAALASAESLFSTVAPSGVTRANRAQFTSLAALLDQYNNGLVGPGHCTE